MLGGVIINVHRPDPKLEEALRYVKWDCIVTSVEDWAMWERLKAEFPFLLIYRPIPNGGNADNSGVDPHDLADYAIPRAPRGVVDVIQGYNELVINDEPTQIARELDFSRIVQAHRFGSLSMTSPVGNVESHHIPALMPLIRESTYIGYGGYVKPGSTRLDTVFEPYWLRRPELIWAPEIERQGMPTKEFLKKLIFRETGTYDSWVRLQLQPTAYGELLTNIDLYAKGIGAKTSPFTLTAWEPWRTQNPFEFINYQETLDALREYRIAARVKEHNMTVMDEYWLDPTVEAWFKAGGWSQWYRWKALTSGVPMAPERVENLLVAAVDDLGSLQSEIKALVDLV